MISTPGFAQTVVLPNETPIYSLLAATYVTFPGRAVGAAPGPSTAEVTVVQYIDSRSVFWLNRPMHGAQGGRDGGG